MDLKELITSLEKWLHITLLRWGGSRITLLALVTVVLVLLGARLAGLLIGRALDKLLSRREVPRNTRFAAVKIARYAVYFLGVLTAASTAGIKLQAIFATSAVLLVGVGLALQSLAQDLIAGIVLLIGRPLGRGDFIRVGELLGTVEDIGLRATTVITRDEVAIIVPNHVFVSDQLVNYSAHSARFRASVRVGVAYGSEVSRVREALMSAARAEKAVLTSPLPEVRLDDFGESSLDFSLLVWIADPREDLRILARLREGIDASFRAAGISIPFPQRDLHLRSGLDPLRQTR